MQSARFAPGARRASPLNGASVAPASFVRRVDARAVDSRNLDRSPYRSRPAPTAPEPARADDDGVSWIIGASLLVLVLSTLRVVSFVVGEAQPSVDLALASAGILLGIAGIARGVSDRRSRGDEA